MNLERMTKQWWKHIENQLNEKAWTVLFKQSKTVYKSIKITEQSRSHIRLVHLPKCGIGDKVYTACLWSSLFLKYLFTSWWDTVNNIIRLHKFSWRRQTSLFYNKQAVEMLKFLRDYNKTSCCRQPAIMSLISYSWWRSRLRGCYSSI